MLLKYELGTEATNEAIRSGAMAKVDQAVEEQTKPEASYFGTENGKRTGYIVFDLADPAQIPLIAEPLFSLNSRVEFIPVMDAADLQKGLAEAAQAQR